LCGGGQRVVLSRGDMKTENLNKHFSHVLEANIQLSRVFEKRLNLAREHFSQRTKAAFDENLAQLLANPALAWDFWAGYCNYAADSAQRAVLFWDTLRQRGNQYLEHERAGKPPVLHFDYEIVLDARKFKH